jgi:uncharacterized delta-60 repeat protein
MKAVKKGVPMQNRISLINGGRKTNLLLNLLLLTIAPANRSHGQDAATVDMGFNANLRSGLNVSTTYAMAVQDDGKILVAGILWTTNSAVSMGLVRLNPDGSIDPTFRSALQGSEIFTVAVQRDQHILVGGWFTYDLNGVSRSSLARLNPDGSPDLSFDPGSGSHAMVSSVVELPDGRILVGGNFFWSYGGTGRTGLVRLQQNGLVDPDFQSLPSWSIASVESVALAANDRILIRGTFAATTTNLLPSIQRLNANGSVDATFAPPDMLWPTCPSIALRPDGKVLVATAYSGGDNLMLLNADGSRDTNFVTNVYGPASNENPPGVQVIALQANGRILIGGKFTRINDVARRNIARLESDGRLDTSFDAGAGPVRPSDTVSYMVDAMHLLNDGHILVAGPFETFSGKPRSGIVKLFGDPLPHLEAASVVGGSFQASVMANLGDVIDIQTSINLVDWAPCTTLTNETGTTSFADPSAGLHFYRAAMR